MQSTVNIDTSIQEEMGKNDSDLNLSRRKFLRQLGMGVGSAALLSIEPLTSLAGLRKKPTHLYEGNGNQDKTAMTYRVNRHTQDKISLLGYGMMRPCTWYQLFRHRTSLSWVGNSYGYSLEPASAQVVSPCHQDV